MDKKEQETVRNLTARLTMTEDSRVKRCLFHTSYTIFSVFYTKPISIKSLLIYITGGLRVILEIKIEGLR